jgi:hypothetical protein
VAAIIPEVPADAGKQLYRDIRLRLRASDSTGQNPNGLIRVHQSHPGFMPLAYVLLFPKGDNGWCQGVAIQSHFSSLFIAHKLFQQYIVDAWAMCELNKLEYF